MPKIEDLTLLTLVYLQTKGKRENGSLLLRNLQFAKIRHIGDYFADSGCKMEGRFTDSSTDFGVGFCSLARANIALLFSSVSEILSQPKESVGLIRFGFGEAIFFLPLLALL